MKITRINFENLYVMNKTKRMSLFPDFHRVRLIILTFIYPGILSIQAQVSNITIDVSKPGANVAPICGGQQIEEFNHQFQGGLYAQLISNPSFEEVDTIHNSTPTENWYLTTQGTSKGNVYGQTSVETGMLNSFQGHCIKMEVISVASGSIGLANGGYWGIKLENNTKYKVSFWAKKDSDFKGAIKVKLEGNDGTVYAQSRDFKPDTIWEHFSCVLTTKDISHVTGDNRFVIYASSPGSLYFDVVTVMPPTWKNRQNGLRPDLAEKMAALKFKFIQFPGGCTVESASMDKCWNWKKSVGPLEQRAGSTRNRWWYKNDLYFGLDEYFQLCEDMGAEPVYTTSAGIDERPNLPEWYALCPLDQMQPIIDDILDLLEYCNGSVSTTWGAKRAANGHRKPYHLKYIEIGNENYRTTDDYNIRYKMIYNAIKEKYPDIKVMYNSTSRNFDLETAGNQFDFTDEHFYRNDLSEFYNKYDSVNPICKKICVAEYASSIHGNGGDVIGNHRDAVNDAVFMLGCEKNSEKMWWTGYGNYGGIVDHSNFGPCIVWNDAVSCFATPSYYMQKMLFADNQGTRILPFSQSLANCYCSTSIDRESGRNDILIKIANNSDIPETVNISLKGATKVDTEGHSLTLTGLPDDENTLQNPTKVVPLEDNFVAGNSFTYNFPAWSVSVLRIHLLNRE